MIISAARSESNFTMRGQCERGVRSRRQRFGALVLTLVLGRCFLQPSAASAQATNIDTVTLTDLLRHAKQDPPSVKQAFAALERARSERSAARGGWIPSLQAEASIGYAYSDQIIIPGLPRIDSLSVDARVTVGLDWAALDFARGANISARGASVESQRFASLAAQRMAAALAAELYLRAGAATELIEDAKLSLERRTRQHQAISELVSSGNRSPVEAERAKVEMLSAKFGVAIRESDELASFAALAVAMGRPATKPVRPASNSAAFPAVAAVVTAERAQKLALQNRSELQAAAWAVTALREDYSAAILARLPTLGVTASALAQNTDLRSGAGIEGDAYASSVGVYLRWRGIDPVVLFRGTVAEAAALQAERDRDAATQSIGAQAVAQFYALRGARLERERSIEVLRAAGATRDAQNDRYRVGVGSLLELLDAEDLEQVARQRRIEAERDEAIAAARLLTSCGLMLP